MTITIGSHEFKLNQQEVAFSRKTINQFVELLTPYLEKGQTSLYLTLVLTMYLKSTKMLDAFGLDNIQALFEQENSEKAK